MRDRHAIRGHFVACSDELLKAVGRKTREAGKIYKGQMSFDADIVGCRAPDATVEAEIDIRRANDFRTVYAEPWNFHIGHTFWTCSEP